MKGCRGHKKWDTINGDGGGYSDVKEGAQGT